MATWTDPKVFADSNNVSSAELNKYLSENMRYLIKRPMDRHLLVNTGTWSTSSNTWTVVDTDIRLSITTQRVSSIMLELSAMVSVNNANQRQVFFDVQMDGDLWLSSGTSTQQTNGAIETSNHAGVGILKQATMRLPFVEVPIGTHYFDLHWQITPSSTVTMYTNPTFMFSAREEN